MPEGQRSAGDSAQVRLIVEQVVDAAIVRLGTTPTASSKQEKAEIPPILKTAGVIISALLTSGIVALALWLVSTLNEMQVTVARIDERQQSQAGDLSGRFQDVDRRITRLESFHATRDGSEKP